MSYPIPVYTVAEFDEAVSDILEVDYSSAEFVQAGQTLTVELDEEESYLDEMESVLAWLEDKEAGVDASQPSPLEIVAYLFEMIFDFPTVVTIQG